MLTIVYNREISNINMLPKNVTVIVVVVVICVRIYFIYLRFAIIANKCAISHNSNRHNIFLCFLYYIYIYSKVIWAHKNLRKCMVKNKNREKVLL